MHCYLENLEVDMVKKFKLDSLVFVNLCQFMAIFMLKFFRFHFSCYAQRDKNYELASNFIKNQLKFSQR